MSEVGFQIGKRKRPFAQIPNETLRDARLSLKSTAVLAYLLSFPDEWEVRIPDLQERFQVGTKVLRRAFKELCACGYATLRHVKDPKSGGWIGRRYLIRETPEVTQRATSPKVDLSLLRKERILTCGYTNRRGKPVDLVFTGDGLPNTTAGKLCSIYYQFLSTNRLLPKRTKAGRTITIKPQFRNWVSACEAVLEHTDRDEFKEVMRWYFDNYRDPYLRTHRSFVQFCAAFEDIKKAMFRQQKRRSNNAEDSGPKGEVEIEK